MPDVRVTDDPVVVFIMVGLFAGAAIVALLAAGPWFSRVPEVTTAPNQPPRRDAAADASPDPAGAAVEGTARPSPGVPWSTAGTQADGHWQMPRRRAPED